jgi:hypothetical protein
MEEINNKLFKSIRDSLNKPSLLARIMFEDSGFAKPDATSMAGGATKIVATADAASLYNDLPPYIRFLFARAMVFLVIVVISMWIAMKITTIPVIQDIVMGDVDVNDKTTSGHKKWIRLNLLMWVYLLLFVVVFYVVRKVIWGAMYMWYSGKGNIPDVVKHTDIMYQLYLTNFASKQGPGDISSFNTFLSYSLWFVLILFIFYTLFVKSFFRDLAYPSYHEDDYDEPRTEKKFLVHQTIVILYVLLFLIGIYCAHHSSGNAKEIMWLLYMYLIIGSLTLMIHLAWAYDLKKKLLHVFLILILLALVAWLNYLVLEGNA